MVTPTGIVPGSRIGGKYEVVEVIGYGGMGVVYKVREQVGAVSRIRALKTVLPRHASNASIVARFREEAEKMCLLEHDNIVPVLSYSEEGEFPYLVMPFIEGQTLKDYLVAHMAKYGRPLPLVDVAEIGLQITRGLEVAHHFANPETGKISPIVHRDIKPGNIMVRIEGREGERHLRVLIMDFGIAKLVSDEDTGHTLTDVIGTVKYASPEQVQRSKDIDPRADIYSLGMVLYELYCGRHVFSDMSEHGVLMRMMQRVPEAIVPSFPDSSPPEFRELIAKSIAIDRSARWTDVTEVRTVLRKIHEVERERRSDDSRQAEELAMERRSVALGTGAGEFAASAFSQAEKIAEQAKVAREKSLHTEATQLFQAAATAFEQAAGFASTAREREKLVARMAALGGVRDAAVAAGSADLAPAEHGDAMRATEAAERALAANDLANGEREVRSAERNWTNARQTAERESARREMNAAYAEIERAVGKEGEAQSGLPTGIRSAEASKRLGEARAQLEVARTAVRTDDPRQAAPALAAARAALDAASGARAAHLERAIDEQADGFAARVHELEPARGFAKLAPAFVSLEKALAAIERDRSEGRAAKAIERLETARREADALAREIESARAGQASVARARDEAAKRRAEAQPFADSSGGKEEFRLGMEAAERAEQAAEADLPTALREYESAAKHFERARSLEHERLRRRTHELRAQAEGAAGELRAVGDRFASAAEAQSLFTALERAVRHAGEGRFDEAIPALEKLPERFRDLAKTAKRTVEMELVQKAAAEAKARAERASERVRELPAKAQADERAQRGQAELRRGTDLFRREDWRAAKKALDVGAETLESLATQIEEEARAERLHALKKRLRDSSDALAAILPTKRKLRRTHLELAKLGKNAEAAIEAGDEARASQAIAELEPATEKLERDVAASANKPPSRAPLFIGGAAVAGAAAAALYFAMPISTDPPRPRATPVDVARATVGPRATSAPAPTTIPTIALRPTVARPTAAPIVIAPTAAPMVPTEAPVIIAKPTIVPPTPLPRLALASAQPEARSLRIPLGGEQRFAANVTAGDASALTWRVDEREAGRGGTFVFDRRSSATPGSRRVALVARLRGRAETLATWQVDVQAPQLAFADVAPGSSRIEREPGAQVDFEATVQPSNIDGLDYQWSVNGERTSTRGSRYRFRPTNPGAYTVTVRASAPWGSSIDRSWDLTVKAPKPTPPPIIEASRPKGSEGELRQWISTYCAAFESKDTQKLLALGHLKNAAEAERLSEALSVMQNLKLSCTNPSVRVDGDSATVSFDRTDRWTDPRGNPVERTLPRITKSLRREGNGWIVVR